MTDGGTPGKVSDAVATLGRWRFRLSIPGREPGEWSYTDDEDQAKFLFFEGDYDVEVVPNEAVHN